MAGCRKIYETSMKHVQDDYMPISTKSYNGRRHWMVFLQQFWFPFRFEKSLWTVEQWKKPWLFSVYPINQPGFQRTECHGRVFFVAQLFFFQIYNAPLENKWAELAGDGDWLALGMEHHGPYLEDGLPWRTDTWEKNHGWSGYKWLVSN